MSGRHRVGHSFAGLLAAKLLGQGIGTAAIVIDPAQIKGVLPLPLAQLRSGRRVDQRPTPRHSALDRAVDR